VSIVRSTPRQAGHAPVNGIQMYYEVHGPTGGVPLFLLPGGGSTIDVSFGGVLPHLAAERTVVALEEVGHGRSSARDVPITFESSADDVAALSGHLGFGSIDVFGFSNGASVGLQVAIRHQALVRRLVFCSAVSKRSGGRREFWDFIAAADFSMMPQELKDAFLAVNPDPQQLRAMHDKDLERMRTFPDVPDAALRSLQAGVLILAGDRDVVTLEHIVELGQLIPDARVMVVPGGHGEFLGHGETQEALPSAQLTAGMVLTFLRN